MNRQIALAKFIKKHSNDLSIGEIKLVKDALKWYGEDVDEDNWESDIILIAQSYVQMFS